MAIMVDGIEAEYLAAIERAAEREREARQDVAIAKVLDVQARVEAAGRGVVLRASSMTANNVVVEAERIWLAVGSERLDSRICAKVVRAWFGGLISEASVAEMVDGAKRGRNPGAVFVAIAKRVFVANGVSWFEEDWGVVR